MPNVIQAEFFHQRNDSPDAFAEDLRNALVDGLETVLLTGVQTTPRLKTVVRFYDKGGFLTSKVEDYERIDEQHTKLVRTLIDAKGFRRRWIDYRSRRLIGKMLALQEDMHRAALNELALAVRKKWPIATELEDHRFRFARPDETHELWEAARKTYGVWIFLFAPNDDLLSDKNYVLARVM